jgi:ribosomal protein S18 acetylase RimI-like enzyme
MSALQIRACLAGDFYGVAALLGQLWPEKRPDHAALRAVYDRALACDSQAYICAAEGERIVGFASLAIRDSLWQEGGLAHVDELVVDEEHRGRGAGARLLEHLAALVKERGCRRIELDSAYHRQEAQRFYERQGFENRGCIFSKPL